MTSFTGPVTIVKGQESSSALVVSGDRVKDEFGGIAVFSQSATVNMQTATAPASAFQIPSGSIIESMKLIRLEDQLATAASRLHVRVGTSASEDRYGQVIVGTSTVGLGVLDFTQSGGGAVVSSNAGNNWHAPTTANTPIFVKTTAVSGAVTGKNGMLTVTYIRR